MRKIIITGAAGLVGQNLVARLKNRTDLKLVAIDKHTKNVDLFRQIHHDVEMIEADLAVAGEWQKSFAGADSIVLNQAQIGGLFEEEFIANNITATERILDAVRINQIPYFVHISSSVVNSLADDFYTRSKKNQENIVECCGIPHATLRPTLMFGWFDRKHLGWLRRFMDRTIVFPIPGNGKFIRQPLYVGDFIEIIATCLDQRKTGTYDISGQEKIYYRDLIQMIHGIVRAKSQIVCIPYHLFWWMLWIYACFDNNPPFTTSQLEALVVPEVFPVTDWPNIFDVSATPLIKAIEDTYLNPFYSEFILNF